MNIKDQLTQNANSIIILKQKEGISHFVNLKYIAIIIMTIIIVGCSDDLTQAETEILSTYNNEILNGSINPDIFSKRGMLRIKQKNYPGAIVDFTHVITSLDKRNESADTTGSDGEYQLLAESFHYRGYSKFQLQDFMGAQSDFTDAIYYNSNNSESYSYRANAELKLGNRNNACLDWSKAGELGESEAYELIKKYCQ